MTATTPANAATRKETTAGRARNHGGRREATRCWRRDSSMSAGRRRGLPNGRTRVNVGDERHPTDGSVVGLASHATGALEPVAPLRSGLSLTFCCLLSLSAGTKKGAIETPPPGSSLSPARRTKAGMGSLGGVTEPSLSPASPSPSGMGVGCSRERRSATERRAPLGAGFVSSRSGVCFDGEAECSSSRIEFSQTDECATLSGAGIRDPGEA
mmetsp:Transcript_72322/g.170125  ORF Transcript_72322/g.170125 Transcript_72322/m.170125 type:complete len:212 (+) Transcript_72322:790-1425(+)